MAGSEGKKRSLTLRARRRLIQSVEKSKTDKLTERLVAYVDRVEVGNSGLQTNAEGERL